MCLLGLSMSFLKFIELIVWVYVLTSGPPEFSLNLSKTWCCEFLCFYVRVFVHLLLFLGEIFASRQNSHLNNMWLWSAGNSPLLGYFGNLSKPSSNRKHSANCRVKYCWIILEQILLLMHVPETFKYVIQCLVPSIAKSQKHESTKAQKQTNKK